MFLLGRYVDRGLKRMRPGSLIRANGFSEVSVVSYGERLPIADWETFLSLGYESHRIFVVPPSTIDQVAYHRGAIITSELTMLCRVPSCSGESCSDTSLAGGGGVDEDAGGTVQRITGPGENYPLL